MGKRLVLTGARQLDYEMFDDVPLKSDEVRIKTLYSGISAGTEMTQYRGTNPFMHKHWDENARLFVSSDQASWNYPVRNLGYEEVGEVVEIGTGVTDVSIGARVFGTWGHATHHVANLDYVRPRLMPQNAEAIFGIFSHIGAIALNGIHDAHIRIGDTVAVFGLGVLGQIVVQAAQQSGARVIGVDMLDARLDMAKRSGAFATLNAKNDAVAETIKRLTDGRGADVCIEASGSTNALNEAIRAAAYSARVVAMGFFQGEAKGLFLGEEFHHNRVNVVGSQISGVDPESKYRWDKMRLWQTAIRLHVDNVLDVRPLITHRAPFDRARKLYETIDRTPDQVVLAVIEFGD